MESNKAKSLPQPRSTWSLFLIRTLVSRDLKAQYADSFLGALWAVIHPLLTIALYYFVFGIILSTRPNRTDSEIDFVIWFVAGMLPWLFFSEVINRSPTAVKQNAQLIKKTLFPAIIGPVTQLFTGLTNHLIALAIFFLILFLTGAKFSWQTLWLIPILAATSLFVLGLSWLISSLSIFLPDLGQIIGVFVLFWFFLTPIVYPASVVPEPFQQIYHLNPMLHVVDGYRAALVNAGEFNSKDFIYLAGVASVIAICGRYIFDKLEPSFADFL